MIPIPSKEMGASPDVPVRVWRAQITDIQTNMHWLYERVKDKYPQAHITSIHMWLRQELMDNGSFMVCTAGGFGFFKQMTGDLGECWCEEKFVLTREGHENEAHAIYEAVRRWMTNQFSDMKTMRVEAHTDAPRAMIEAAMGVKVTRKDTFWVRVRKSGDA